MQALLAHLAAGKYLKNVSAALVLVFLLVGCQAEAKKAAVPTVVSLRGRTMGTTYSVKCWHATGITAEKDLHKAIKDLLETINQQMSTYIADSELSQFNASDSDEWMAVSAETAKVVKQAVHFNQITGGASDVTVGPLVKLWNFGPGKNPFAKPPADEQIESALEAIGCEHIEVRQDPPAIRKLVASLEIDLSSIAKGYAVDAVSELLIAQGYKNAMVEIGGEVRTAGTRLDGTSWRIGVEPPATNRGQLYKVMPLNGLAMATSGDYRNFLKTGERKYCHILDPRTGQPLEFRGCSVTVLAESCLEADALATALLVMRDEAGYDWCVEQNVAALFLARGDDTIDERATPRFTELAPNIQPAKKR